MALKVIAQTNGIYLIFDLDQIDDQTAGSLVYNYFYGECSDGPHPRQVAQWFPWEDPDPSADLDSIVVAALAVPVRKSWPELHGGLPFTPVPVAGSK